jgi:hypothetical protein
MDAIQYDYDDVPTLRRFAKSNKRIRGVMGPIGSGKSSACAIEIIRRAKLQAPASDGVRYSRWLVVRNFFPQLRDTTIKTFHDWLPPFYFGHWKQTEHTYLIDKIVLPDGTKVNCEVLFRALDRPEHTGNLLSLELTGAWVNEAREIPKALIDLIDTRINRYPSSRRGGITWTGMWMDTNPPDTDSWWYKMFEKEKPDDTELFKQPSGRSNKAENIKHLPNGYYTKLSKGKDPEFIKVYVDGEYGYVRDGKPVYMNYSDEMHLAKEDLTPIPGLALILGFDFGYRNPACVMSQLTPSGHYRILREWHAENMGIRNFVRDIIKPELMTTYRGYEVSVTGDPAGAKKSDTDAKSCYTELYEAGLPVMPAFSNSMEARFNAVNAFLIKLIEGKPAFQLSPNCNLLRKGFLGGYHYKRMSTSVDDVFYDVPQKNIYSHVHDALQYNAMYLDRAFRVNTVPMINSPLRMEEPVSDLAWT